jgi:hypothetical protein
MGGHESGQDLACMGPIGGNSLVQPSALLHQVPFLPFFPWRAVFVGGSRARPLSVRAGGCASGFPQLCASRVPPPGVE